MKSLLCAFLALTLLISCSSALAEAEWQVFGMTVRQLIMQKVMVSVRQWSDTDPADKDERKALPALTEMNAPVEAFLSGYQPGGVILFAQNTQTTEGTFKLIQAMKAAVTSSGAPQPLVAVDQEGGYITRLAQGTSMPGSMALGATGNADNARLAAQVMGEELKALGFNMDCAPSLDVNCNPLNPIINVRSFGESPAVVSAFGLAFIEGLQSQGIISVVKHFPGHGDTQTDSHSSLPLVDKPLEAIKSTELVPFQAAIDAGVQVVMTAHIQYPALDSATAISAETGEAVCLPATLSKKILTGVLRGQMGFEGVIITDAMNMDAIARHFGAGEAMIRAFDAGVDIALMPMEIMCPGDIAAFEAALRQVEEAVADGRLNREALEASVKRILQLKARNGVLDAAADDGGMAAAAATVASVPHRTVERALADAAVTVLKNESILPLTLREGDTLLLCTAYQNEATALRFGVERLMTEGVLPKLAITDYAYQGCTEIDETLKALINAADAVIMDSEITRIARLAAGNWPSDMPLSIVDALNQLKRPYCVISVHLPQDAALLLNARALVAVYNSTGMSDAAYADPSYAYGPNLPAAVDVIFGAYQPQGTLPVTVYALNEARELDLETVLYPVGYAASQP